MAFVAIVLFAFGIGGQAAHEPFVVWIFSLSGCEGCRLQQLRLFEEFHRARDEVYLYFPSEQKEQAEALKAQIEQRAPMPRFRMNPKGPGACAGTGYEWHDALTGELVAYCSRQGSYNLGRARVVLALFREPARE